MTSSHSAVRKSLRGLEDGLSLFTTQLAQETGELRRNVESRPRTGATYYRNILEDLLQRAEGVGQELAALDAVSTEAVSLEELVGHSVALYCQNHRQIQELESQLAKFGYRDLFAPLPPESPLDMLELTSGGGGHRGRGAAVEEVAEECCGDRAAEWCADGGEHPGAAGAADADSEALGEVTNRLTAAHLGAAAAAAVGGGCEVASPVPGGQGGCVPKTTLKAMAPMTAAKALMRDDTPSSVASPEAMSPSMRELLGKYAASSGAGTHQPDSGAGAPASGSSFGGTPRQSGRLRATPPVASYLSPAFQLAAMEQEVQMAHAETAAAVQAGGGGGTPVGAGRGAWQADDAMYDALTATAKKLAGKPSFMEAYRQKFPAIVASTERLLQTVEKQRRPAAAAAVAEEEAAAGPVAALALAAQAAAGHTVVASGHHYHQQEEQQQQQGAPSWHASTDEESTMDLMAQVLRSRLNGHTGGDERTEEFRTAAAEASSTQFQAAAAAHSPPLAANAAAAGQQAPSTAALLSGDLAGGGAAGSAGSIDGTYGAHPISSLRADPPQATAPVAASVPRSERSKPQLEEAIAAALRRNTTTAPASAAPASAAPASAAPAAHAASFKPSSTAPAAAPASAAAASGCPASSQAAAAAAHPPAVPAVPAPLVAPPAGPASVLRSTARPPPPPAAPAGPAAAAPAAQLAVPPLRLVEEEDFAVLPNFIRSQLPLGLLNDTLAAVHAVAQERCSGFTMEDVEATGLVGAKHKVVVNSLVKLGRVQLQVARGGQGTLYILC